MFQMTDQKLHLLALQSRPPASLPKPGELDDVGALLYRRPSGSRTLRLEAIRDAKEQTAPTRAIPRRLRKLSGRGILSDNFGWFRSELIMAFTDGTIYGHTSTHKDTCSDLYVITQDFVAHGQRDLSGAPIHPQIKTTRYGVPLYQLDGESLVLPIYLRYPMTPPRSDHDRIMHVEWYQGQINMILDLLEIHLPETPELTWLHPRNYSYFGEVNPQITHCPDEFCSVEIYDPVSTFHPPEPNVSRQI